MKKISKSVSEYIESTPREVQPKFNEIRAGIREAAPDAVESISYGMPIYSFRSESGFKARLCYFGLLKNKKRIAFYTRPMFLEEYKDEVKQFLPSQRSNSL